MPDNRRPGRPFPNAGGPDYPRPTAEDLDRTRLQTGRLSRDPQQLRKRLRERHAHLINRRGRRRGGVLNPSQAPLDQFVDETGQPMLTNNEIVVRTDDMDDVRQVLGQQRNLNEQPVEGLDGKVTLLSDARRRAVDLAMLVEDLQDAGIDASMNQVAPCGYVTKADPFQTGAEPTKRKVTHRTGPEIKREVTVAVIDTGVSDQVRSDGWLGVQLSSADVDPLYEIARDRGPSDVFDYCAGHGSFVTGIIQQVAPRARLLIRRAIGADGIGFDVDVAIAMLQAFRDGADLINLSVGTETPGNLPPVASQVALEIIAAELAEQPGRDVVLVAAAGNNGTDRPVFPAAFSAVPTITVPVVAVAGLDPAGDPALFSTFGSWITCSTTASCVLSPFVQGQEPRDFDPNPDTWHQQDPWAIWTGTSFAAPQIAGALALRCQTEDESPSAGLTWLLGQGPTLARYGKTLQILPST